MGLLMSDSLQIDPTMYETMRMLDSLSELAYQTDAAHDMYEDEAPTQTIS